MTINELRELKQNANLLVATNYAHRSYDYDFIENCHACIEQLIDAEVDRIAYEDDGFTTDDVIKWFTEERSCLVERFGPYGYDIQPLYTLVVDILKERNKRIQGYSQCEYCKPGSGFKVRYREYRDDPWVRTLHPRFCPNCGKRLEAQYEQT